MNTRSGTSPPEMLRLPRSNATTCSNDRSEAMSAASSGEIASTKRWRSSTRGKRHADADEPVRVWIGERLHHQAVDEPADQTGAANAEGQGEDGRPGNAGPTHEETKSLTEILQRDVNLPAGPGWERVHVGAGMADESTGVSMLPAQSHRGCAHVPCGVAA